jgi:hypothetical protein
MRLTPGPAGLLAASLALAAMPAEAVELASHRAAYRLVLDPTRASQDVESASGAMLYEVVDRCGAWTVQQRFTLQVVGRGGQAYEMSSDYVTWETQDGTRLRFRLRQATDGAVTKTVVGEARVDGPGLGGSVRFTSPAERELRLPRGTLFPMIHTLRLIEAAKRGERTLAAPLFDGTSEDGPQDTNAVIITMIPADPAVGYAALRDLRSWRVRIAFFEPGGASQPDYEVGIRYFENGVADELKMDFGEFAVAGTLAEFERLPGGCN